MFTMVALTAVVLVLLFRSRVRAIREKAVKQSYFKVYQGQVEPEYAAKRSRRTSPRGMWLAMWLYLVVRVATTP